MTRRIGRKPRAMPGGINRKARLRLRSAQAVPFSRKIKQERVARQKGRRQLDREWDALLTGGAERIAKQMKAHLDRMGITSPTKQRAIIRDCITARQGADLDFARARLARESAVKYKKRFRLVEANTPAPADDPKLRESAKVPKIVRLRYLMKKAIDFAESADLLDAHGNAYFETPPNSVRMIWGKNAPAMWALIRAGMLSSKK